MPIDFKFPDIGKGITEGEIVKWQVKEGDRVEEHQTIASIETDKAIADIPSPRSGIILKIHHKEGDIVKVGETLVTIGEQSETIEELPELPSRPTASVVGVLEEPHTVSPRPTRIAATPATRRLARELAVDLTEIAGTGLQGRITEDDVRKFAQSKKERIEVATKPAEKRDTYGCYDVVPMKGVRRSTAKRMVESFRTAVHVTHMDEADVTELVAFREKQNKIAEKRGVHLTYMPFIVKAVVAALKQYPYLNSSVDDEHEEIILKKYYNIGVAADTPDGLIVPVVKDADQKEVFTIAQEIQDLTEKAQSREIILSDLKGGTFTITNIGFIGGTHATPITNYPETAILATGRIRETPVVRDGQIVIRSIMPLSLSFDHRVTDGALAARFVNMIMKFLHDPTLLL
jgi:pyruvate dehydrogenase E2 component (dihydrolipoamide acetyltransferase)